MKETLMNFISEHGILAGVIIFSIGLLMLLLRVQKKESFKMKDHGVGSWEELMGYWGTLIGLIICGLIMILKNLSY